MVNYCSPTLCAPPVSKLDVARGIAEHSQRIARELQNLPHRPALEWLDESISELPSLTPFIVAALEAADVFLVSDLLNRSVEDLLAIRNVGRKSVLAIYASLALIGWTKRTADVFTAGRTDTPISATLCRTLAAQVGQDRSDEVTGAAAGPQTIIRTTIPECDFFGAVKEE